MNVLLVVDDLQLAAALAAALRRSGHRVAQAGSATAALSAPPPDVVILAFGHAADNGVNLCRLLSDRGEAAIIMLSARGGVADRVAGLRAGADDYLVRPFSYAELEARMEAVLRRAGSRPPGSVTVGRLRIEPEQHQAYIGPEPIPLTRKQFELLAALARQPGVVVRRDRLIADIWRSSWTGRSRTLDVHIATLRAKIRAAARVEAVRGVGYRLVARGAPAAGTG